MSKDITDWIKNELYPTLFHSIDTALPEHDFKHYSGGWRSKTYLDGSPHKNRADKTVVSKKAPGWILENGGEVVGLVDYVMRRDRVEFIQAVKTLADVVGLQLPKGEFTQESYQRYKDQAILLEDCNSYFIYCLANSTEADEVRAYLSSRGYSDEDIKVMELGYIPDQDKLFKHLLSKGYSQRLIDEVVKLNKDIGSTHRLSIPYRSGGSLKGFVVRTVIKAEPKYLLSTGLRRGEGFFNISSLKGDKDLIVVEGYLDALISQAKGLENVVALGGAKLSQEQVRDAIKRGAKSFTLCLDNDEAGKNGIDQAIEVILGEGVNRVYIVTLPDLGGGKTDPDSLIKESGVEAFREAIRGALPYYDYRLQETLNKYGKIEEERELQPKDIDSLLDEVVETASRITDATDRDRYKKLFTSLDAIKGLGISEESLSITVDRLTSTRDKESQANELKQLLNKASDYQAKGETKKALELLETSLTKVKQRDKATEFSRLLLPTSEAQMREEESSYPESLLSGISLGDEPLLLPAGALSIYAAPTNHGKTMLLINTVLNVLETYPEKKIIFFTYEERSNAIIQYFLNTYINLNLNSSNKTNRRIIKDHYRTGSTEFISYNNLEYFEAKKKEFFKTYIETGRLLVKYVELNSEELTSAIKYLTEKDSSIGGVFIDYIQLLNLPEGKDSSRQLELSEICRSLKETAVNTMLPFVLAAQFNREVKALTRMHPTAIREAGDIEHSANVIVGFWNMQKETVDHILTKEEKMEIDNKIRKGGVEGLCFEGSYNEFMYGELLKSREQATGSYSFLELNGNTGKIKNREDIISQFEETVVGDLKKITRKKRS